MALSKDAISKFGSLGEIIYKPLILCVQDPIKVLKNVKGYPKGMVSAILRDGSNEVQGKTSD